MSFGAYDDCPLISLLPQASHVYFVFKYFRLLGILTRSDLFQALFHVSPQQLWQLDRSRPRLFTEITTLISQGEFRVPEIHQWGDISEYVYSQTRGFLFVYLYSILSLWTWIPECVLNTDVPCQPRWSCGQAVPASAHAQYHSCAERLLFFLYLLFSSSLSPPGLNQQTTIPPFLTFSCGTAGDLWPLAAAFRNLCFTNVRLLSLISHVTFPQ